MPLPSSGQLSFSQIACELKCGTPYSNLSLRNMSSTAGKTQPDAVSEFYGYSYTFSVQYLVVAGGGGGGAYGACKVGGNGGSGVVILRYPNTVSLCIGSGLTAVCTNCSVGTNERYTCITSGTGNVCWV